MKGKREKESEFALRDVPMDRQSWDSPGRGVTELWYQNNYIRSEGCEVQ